MVSALQGAYELVGRVKPLQEYLDVLELEETYRPWHPSSPHFRDGETEAQGRRGDTNKSSGRFKKEETHQVGESGKTPWRRRHLKWALGW